MRILCYLVLLLTFGIASAQTATILQGDYISNVFGNSNFVLNPNAQTSNCTTSGTITCANVTVSSASITRSTTTPLVARTEFLMTTSTATGFADWALRTFDQGMKGQNCEARFTYKGFTVGTTTAQIHQGSNVVAQLTLTPSATDPRIASINFPCGDLSQVTKFRLQQATASLTGTNEIGGIYVGLATNMANVAQAEFVGSLSYQDNGSCQWTRAGTGANFGNFAADTDCPINQVTGACSDAGKIPGMTCNLTKPGRYEVIVQQRSRASGISSVTNLYRIHDGTTGGPTSVMYQTPNITGYDAIQTQTLTASYEYTTGGTKTFQVQASTGVGNTSFIYGNETNPVWEMKVYRFPSSSELVVTPERQNWYVNAYQGDNGSYPSLGTATVASYTEITGAGLSMTPESGSQPAAALCQSGTSPSTPSTSSTNCGATNESMGIAFAIPTVGQYEVCAEFTHAPNQNAGGSADVYFQLAETNLNNTTVLQSYTSANNGAQAGSSTFLFQTPVNMCRIFTFNSIGTKGVRLLYRQTVTGTIFGNVIATDTNLQRALRWKIQPVTNQSNSALYVQGPVKAAETGAAIPSGYVGEVKRVRNAMTNAGATGVWKTTNSLTLEAGTWMCQTVSTFECLSMNCSDPLLALTGTVNGNNVVSIDGSLIGVYAFQTGWQYISQGTMPMPIRSNGSILTFPDGSTTPTNVLYSTHRITYPSGTPRYSGELMCIRSN